MVPVSSLTMREIASVVSVMPMAARWRVVRHQQECIDNIVDIDQVAPV